MLSVQIELPDGFQLHPTAFQRIDRFLRGRAPVFRSGPKLFGLTFAVSGTDNAAALDESRPIVVKVLKTIGLQREAVTKITLVNVDEIDQELDQIPELVGLTEAAAILGVSRQRVHQLAQKNSFPSPVARLSSGSIWRETEVRNYGITRHGD
jgi:predicted DNA-binding transcriptional regulator AlpA